MKFLSIILLCILYFLLIHQGLVVGCLSPLHASTSENQNILLVKIDDLCIAIAERGVREFQVMEKDTMKPNPNH